MQLLLPNLIVCGIWGVSTSISYARLGAPPLAGLPRWMETLRACQKCIYLTRSECLHPGFPRCQIRIGSANHPKHLVRSIPRFA
ncbi:hypothetical protein FIBSPDRAFT_339455 [Athelia psychrophila]|uniref:Secreted protein n=1 Tax=Athelia psychrophila TaxID=1759441 RepID=A0A167W8W8_9AGAM|nr:hypothetical protein FIBSPDRAFT_339455 [Fibularhizoctonia sp. CBS 109695]